MLYNKTQKHIHKITIYWQYIQYKTSSSKIYYTTRHNKISTKLQYIGNIYNIKHRHLKYVIQQDTQKHIHKITIYWHFSKLFSYQYSTV